MAVECKSAAYFVASIIDPERILFRQMADLSRTYNWPVLILEGRDFYSTQMNVSSIQEALVSVAVDYGVPIIPKENQDEKARAVAF